MSALAFFVIYLIASSGSSSCLASSDDYAAEVVIPSYESIRIASLQKSSGDTYIFSSQYSPSLITLVRETDIPPGLSVRLQVPTKIESVEQPHIRLVSNSPKNMRDKFSLLFLGWRIECETTQCIFNKNLASIKATRKISGSEVTIEITKPLEPCSSKCYGICLEVHTKQYCIDNALKQDIDSILRYANISDNLAYLLGNYQIIGSGSIVLLDIVPTETTSIDWREAMRQELVFLKNQGIVNVENEDIEEISQLSKGGQAGQNYRIVYNSKNSTWAYYDNLPDAILISDRDCRAYLSPEEPLVLKPKQGIALFYVIPMLITLASLTALTILIVIARFINKPLRKKRSRNI